MSRATARARSVPAWAWLSGIVVLSIVVHYLFTRRMVAPWIWVDELVYSELAKNFAETGRFAIRGHSTLSYGLVYPFLIAPAYRLFASVPDAYAAAKAINAVLMSLAAIPAYFLARRVVRPTYALIAAVLTVAIPSTLYAGVLMTENAFYPVYILCALLLVLVLERPSLARQLMLAAALGLALETRVQAVALVAAALTAPLLLALMRRASWRRLRPYLPLYCVFGGFALLALTVQAARGHSPLALLGAYEAAGDKNYALGPLLKWLLYHVAEIDLYLAVIGFVPLLLLLAQARSLPARIQPFLAAAAACVAWTTLIVAAFASQNIDRIEERNLFYVAPLFFVATLVWVDLGMPRPRLRTWAIVALAVGLPTLLPYTSQIKDSAQSDTLMLVAAWWVNVETSIPLDRLWLVALGLGLAAALLLLRLRPAAGLALPGLLLAFYLALIYPVEGWSHGIRSASVGSLFQGIGAVPRDWIDRAVGHDAAVAAIWTGNDVYWPGPPRVVQVQPVTIWQNEVFNRSVDGVYNLHGSLPAPPTAEPQLVIGSDGVFRERQSGRPLRAPYVLTTVGLPVAGRIVARDERKGMVVRKAAQPVRLSERWRGLDADRWMRGRASYTRFDCSGGTLTLRVASDSGLFKGVGAQTLVARSGGQVVSRLRFSPSAPALTWPVPLRRRQGRCDVGITVRPSRSPASQGPSSDSRMLGVRVLAYRFLPVR